jgi:hypothetical protein
VRSPCCASCRHSTRASPTSVSFPDPDSRISCASSTRDSTGPWRRPCARVSSTRIRAS